MTEKYRSTFIAIVCFTVFWFFIILLCLPSNDIDGRFRLSPESGGIQSSNSGDSNLLYEQNHIQPPNAPKFMRYFQPNARNFKESDVLFYQFSDDASQSMVSRSISQEEHESETLKLNKTDSLIDKYVKAEGDRLFAFNLLISNRVGAFRYIPDTRNAKCPRKYTVSDGAFLESREKISSPVISNKLKSSIIICHYNEAPSALIRTINTVLARTPLDLIQEIIVVDDFSGAEYQADKIRPHIRSGLVTIVRTPEREGLIRARLFGVEKARGDILVFLDSHVEANLGWLEPLVEVIEKNKTSIACPMIDLINAETLIYTASPMVRGGLKWNLNFKWDSIPSETLKTYDDFIKPVESPTMAGGLFAIHRDFFHQLGTYDSGMDLWGGENVELSLRSWLCGGRILILPCSRLGHIFRKTRPYGPAPDKPDSLLYNSNRAAQVWLDDYIEKFYESNPAARHLDSGDVSKRIELKRSLNCHNFTWFLENVYPSLTSTTAAPQEAGKSKDFVKPKLFKLNQLPKQIDYSSSVESEFRESPINKIRHNRRHAQTMNPHLLDLANRNTRNFRHPLFNNQRMGSSRSQFGGFGAAPKVISKFQIQASNSNLCIESKVGLIGERFARLVLNSCAEFTLDKNNNVIITNTTRLEQLWTETELHDYRIGDSRCLDLVKNMPLIRQCHNMGSFQKWASDEPTNALIYNVDGSLCIGVERVKLGEPIIVTVCDRQTGTISKAKGNDSKMQYLKGGNEIFDKQMMSIMRPARYRMFAHSPVKPLILFQRWNLIRFHHDSGNSSSDYDRSSV